MRILLVDDEPLALDELEALLAATVPDAKRHAFTKAQQAMKFAEENAVDVAFSTSICA